MDQGLSDFNYGFSISIHCANVQTNQHILDMIQAILWGGQNLGQKMTRDFADFVEYFGRDAIEQNSIVY